MPDLLGFRRVPFVIALILAALVVLIEIGSGILDSVPAAQHLPRPGFAITYLAAFDGFLLYSLLLNTVSVLGFKELAGRIQGLLGLIVAILGLLVVLTMLYLMITYLILMVSLLLALIFGTIAYFALFADFDTSGAAVTLGAILMLKLGVAIGLILAHPGYFLKNKSMVVLVLLSLLCTMLISFLHAFPPSFLASITDAIAAIIVAVVALIWLLVLLIFSIPAVVKAVV